MPACWTGYIHLPGQVGFFGMLVIDEQSERARSSLICHRVLFYRVLPRPSHSRRGSNHPAQAASRKQTAEQSGTTPAD